MKNLIGGVLAVATFLVLIPGLAQAVPIFVGTFETDDGPLWNTNPAVYSAVEAAALIFGGTAADYRISTDSNLDWTTITDTGWYTRFGIAGGFEFTDDFKKDAGGAGYGAFGAINDEDISAYTNDNAIGSAYTMYVWSVVPEPTTATLLALGLVGMAAGRRRTAARTR